MTGSSLGIMTHPTDDGVWRDDEKLPLGELDKAMASWDTDGQNDLNDDDTEIDEGEARPSPTGPTGPN